MPLRPTQASNFNLVKRGIALNLSKLVTAQEQIATGKRINRPSDDAAAAARSISIRRQAQSVDSYLESIVAVRPVLETAASQMEATSSLFSEGRAMLLQAMTGTLSLADKEVLADQIDLLRTSMIEVANSTFGDRYLFGGTETSQAPFVEVDGKVIYRGNDEQQRIRVGRETTVDAGISGSDLFGQFEYAETSYTGNTGVASGTSADYGVGYGDLKFRHDATTGALGSGLALAGGGADDTILGDHALVVDATAGTVQLGSGLSRAIPSPADADVADFVVTDADGGELHLDFTGFTGSDFAGTVRGDGSVSFNDQPFVAVTLLETDLELVDASSNMVVHVDTTGVTRSGEELVTFEGTTNIFDTLQAVANDLRGADQFEAGNLVDRMNVRFAEFDRSHENLLSGLGSVGARLQRLDTTQAGLTAISIHLESQLSANEDVDIVSVVGELGQAEQTLQVAQATGARLIQQSLLDFIR